MSFRHSLPALDPAAATSRRRRPSHVLVADQLEEMELVLQAVKCAQGLGGHVLAPGKRVRPMVFLLSYMSVRGWRPRPRGGDAAAIRLAAAIELLHEASLVHDDLIDRSCTRRGRPTVHAVHGDARALLIGDLMLLHGVKLVVDAGTSKREITVGRTLAEAGIEMVGGELDQLARGDGVRSMAMADYLAVITRKTARFFAACAEAGAAVGGASPRLTAAYRDFGQSLGVAFQLADDIIDATGDPDVAHKSLRNDAGAGTVTLPMIHAHRLTTRHPAIAKLAAGDPLQPADQDALYQLLATEAVRRECLVTMEHHVAMAEARLQRLAPSVYRHGLNDVLERVRHSAASHGERPPGAAAPEAAVRMS